MKSEKEAKTLCDIRIQEAKESKNPLSFVTQDSAFKDASTEELNIIIKSDVQGSSEALKMAINNKTFNTTNLRESIPHQICKDDNQKILDLLIERMEIGINRYGQGVRKDDDTRRFGCEDDSWLEMELQEVLDGMIYTATSILRLRDKLRVKQLRL